MSDIDAMKLAAKWWPLPASELAKKIEELQAAHEREVEDLKAVLKATGENAAIETKRALAFSHDVERLLAEVESLRAALLESGGLIGRMQAGISSAEDYNNVAALVRAALTASRREEPVPPAPKSRSPHDA